MICFESTVDSDGRFSLIFVNLLPREIKVLAYIDLLKASNIEEF